MQAEDANDDVPAQDPAPNEDDDAEDEEEAEEQPAQAAAYQAPNGMEDLDIDTAMDWIDSHPNPNEAQIDHLLGHVYTEVNGILRVCGLTRRQILAVIRQGVKSLEDCWMLGKSISGVRETLKVFNGLARNKGGVAFGAIHYINIAALAMFVKDHMRRGQVPRVQDWNQQALRKFVQKAQIASEKDDKEELKLAEPPKLREANFHQWEEAVQAQLRAKLGCDGVPLAYVVRKGEVPEEYTNEVEQLVYQAVQEGPAWDKDNRAVGNYIIGLLSENPAYTWIQAHRKSQDGRAMMTSLRKHFLGPSQIEKIVERARHKRDKAVYKSEAIYPFEKFTTDLEECFTLLADYDEPVPRSEQIRLLRDKIVTDRSDFNAAVATTLVSDRDITFHDAVSKISTFVATFFKTVDRQSRRSTNVSSVGLKQVATDQRDGKLFYKGIDITDPTRSFSKPDYQALIEAGVWKNIAAERDRLKGSRKGGKGSSKRSVKSLKKKVSALTKQVASLSKSDDKDDAKKDDGKESGDSDSEDTGPRKVTKKKRVHAVKVTGTRRSTNVSRIDVRESETYSVGLLEEDSHADMHCAGKNFTLLAKTGYTCDVDPFLDDYDTTQGIEVVKAATAVRLDNGDTIYLVSSSALWFGAAMETSLFNATLARDAGLLVSTDPYDDDRPLGISDRGRGLYVPMTRRGNFIGLESFSPDREEALRALASGENVIYLDKYDEYQPDRESENISHVGFASELDNVQLSMDDPEVLFLRQVSTSLDPEAFAKLSVASIALKDRHSPVTPERVSDIFGCGLQTAKETIRVTTQLGIRSAVHPLRRRYRTDLLSLNYRRLNTTMFADTMKFKTTSLNQNVCAQVYTTGDFVIAYPLRAERLLGSTLTTLAEDVGVPTQLITDNASAMVGAQTQFQEAVRRLRIKFQTIEPHTSRQNKAERVIGELRRRWRDKRRKKNIPRRLWDYALIWCAQIMSRTFNNRLGRTGIEAVTGDTPDISEWTDFDIYDRVWFWDAPGKEDNPKPGRWLGVAHRVGSALCYWVLDANGKVVARTSVQHVTESDMKTEDTRARFTEFDENIKERLRVDGHVQEGAPEMLYEEDVDVDDEFDEFNEGIDQPVPMHGTFINDSEEDSGGTYDEYIGAELIVDMGPEGSPLKGTVVKRLKGEDGKPIGRAHYNPLLDTRQYEVDVEGVPVEFTANRIAENIYSQVDSEGRRELIFREIIDHRSDDRAISMSDGTITTRHGQKRPVITTKGWYLKVEWADGTASWLPLSEVKNSNPVEVAEYAVASKIDKEPAFAWWVPRTLRKRAQIVAKVKSRYWKTTHKYGVRLPHSVEEAYAIDAENRNNLWRDAIEKEMARVRIAFTPWEDGDTVEDARRRLVGYQQIECHMVFDIKMVGLVRKARFVAGGHKTTTPSSITYSSVVSRESVRIAFLYAALNDLDITSADIGNAYLNAPCREKIWTVAGPEFGDDQGSIMIIGRALYGLKSAGAAWRAFFSQALVDLGFKSTRGDADVYIRPQTRPDGSRYYEMMLVYVDDILVISHDPKPIMDKISSQFRLKEGSVGPPKQYLGATIKIHTDDEGRECWAISPDDYLRAVLEDVEEDLRKKGLKLRGKAFRPYDSNYLPEMDVTRELNDAETAKFQGYIGIFRWLIELGRMDILTEVSKLSSHQALPRQGHLEACYAIFAYLRRHPNTSTLCHPARIDIKESRFAAANWTDFYGDVEEELPPDMPEPLGEPMKIVAYVDSDHAGNLVTRRSQTGFIIWCNNTPVLWYSKRQNTVEASTFGAEFIAMRSCLEAIEGLRFKLRMFGIPVEGPADVMCDNNSVVNSGQRPEAVLSKKHLSICFHRVREAVAKGTIRIGKIDSKKNLADAFTKCLPTVSRNSLFPGMILTGTDGLRPVEAGDYRLNKGDSLG